MDYFNYVDGWLHAEEVPLARIAEAFQEASQFMQIVVSAAEVARHLLIGQGLAGFTENPQDGGCIQGLSSVFFGVSASFPRCHVSSKHRAHSPVSPRRAGHKPLRALQVVGVHGRWRKRHEPEWP